MPGVELSDDEENKYKPLEDDDDPLRITHINLENDLHL